MDNASFASNVGTRAVSLEQAASIAGMAEQLLLRRRLETAGSFFIEAGRFVVRPNPADPQGWLITEGSR
jgi:hypothetical protein